jgi:ankyrin repeat protein
MVELLLQQPEVQVNRQNYMGWTPLSKAAFAGHVEVVRRLLQRRDLEINLVDQNRQTPLFRAAAARKLEVVKLLVGDPRTNPSITNRPGNQTAGENAAALGFESIAEVLRNQTARPDSLAPTDPYQPAPPNARTGTEKPNLKVRRSRQ